MKPYQIVLADDHAILRQGIRKIIEEEDGLKVIAEAGDGLELLKTLQSKKPDMVIVDISMPKLRGIEAAVEMKNRYPRLKVLILSMHKSKEYVLQAISAGVDGYLLKEDSDEELFMAITTVRKGEVYLSPNISSGLTRALIASVRRGPRSRVDSLSTREKEVLKLIVEGYTSRDISSMLHISLRTVQHHRANIQRKLMIKKMPDLVKYALDKGYITDPG